MKHTFVLLALLATAFSMLGCTSAPPATTQLPAATQPAVVTISTQPTTAPATEAAVPSKEGGTLLVAITSDPGHFNPSITTGFTTHVVADSMFNGLVGLDENLQPIPDLADEWQVSNDGKTYTFHLHPGIMWHDGTPFTSADVKFSFENILLKFHSRTAAGLTPVLDKIETPDANTVVFHFQVPYGPLLQRLDVTEAPILPQHIYQGTDPQKADANLKPVGTGPFKFVEYAKGDHVTLEKNATYFKKGMPRLDKVIFKVIPDANAALQALQKGEVDYSWATNESQMKTLQGSPGITTAKAAASPGGSFCINTFAFNLEHPPLDKVQVRQAINHAIDRQRIQNQIHFGFGKVATGPISSRMSWFYNPNVTKYDFDVEKAKQLLDQAGVKPGADGARLKLVFPHPTTFNKYGELIREQLGAVGIQVQDAPMDFNAATDRVFVKRDFDLAIVSFCNGPDPEIGVRRVYDSRNIKPIPFSNGAAYKNPRIDELFDKGALTIGNEQRAPSYLEIQDILTKDLPYLWFIETEGTRAHRSEFHDFQNWTGHFAEYAWTDNPK
ncbi:MAG: ABC transporter substrate-binding protein [Chloroflexi bacterium]|nr:ABC transporter substrate-binding protein [Chloroflexota bacterium]